jgi:hypothetical protein
MDIGQRCGMGWVCEVIVVLKNFTTDYLDLDQTALLFCSSRSLSLLLESLSLTCAGFYQLLTCHNEREPIW